MEKTFKIGNTEYAVMEYIVTRVTPYKHYEMKLKSMEDAIGYAELIWSCITEDNKEVIKKNLIYITVRTEKHEYRMYVPYKEDKKKI